MTKAPLTGFRRSLVLVAPMIVGFVLFVAWRFQTDIAHARSRVAHGSLIVATPCGPIEYQEAGSGVPLLAVHGSGGGFDQGMAFAAPLAHACPVINGDFGRLEAARYPFAATARALTAPAPRSG